MWFTLGLLLSGLSMSYAYPSGPPKSVCKDGMPVHTKDGKVIPPQNTSSPFVIDVNSTSINPGDTVRIKVHSNQGDMFRGLFLQMYPIPNMEGDNVKYVASGLFDRKITNIKLMTCTIMLDTLTHDDSFMKIETSFDWRAPLYLKNDVVVRATILKNFDTYWYNVESPRIEVIKHGTSPVEKLEKPWLEEIIKTVKNEDDVKLRQELVRARFERGFRNAIDPNGFIMINYVTNLLPFEDSQVPVKGIFNETLRVTNKSLDKISSGNNNLTADDKGLDAGNQTQTVNQTIISNKNSQNRTEFENETISINSDGDEFSLGQDDLDQNLAANNETIHLTNTKNKSMMKNYYQVLVRSLLKGDKLVADTLSEIIEKN